MDTQLSNAKEVRIPGPDHPITISPAEGDVRVTVAGRIVAESTRALRQGRLHILQHSHWRDEVGVRRLDLRKTL